MPFQKPSTTTRARSSRFLIDIKVCGEIKLAWVSAIIWRNRGGRLALLRVHRHFFCWPGGATCEDDAPPRLLSETGRYPGWLTGRYPGWLTGRYPGWFRAIAPPPSQRSP